MKTSIATLVALLVLASPAMAGEVTMEKAGDDRVVVRIDGDVFAVHISGTKYKKPYFWPVVAPGGFEILGEAIASGDEASEPSQSVETACETTLTLADGSTKTLRPETKLKVSKIGKNKITLADVDGTVPRRDVFPLASVVTRQIVDNPPKIRDRKDPLYYDHPHHKGVWVSVDEVNGIKFWNEDGVIRNQRVELIEPQGQTARMRIVNHWLDEEGQPLVEESTQVSVSDDYLMTVEISFEPAGEEEVTFGDTKEGMFGIRLPNSMREIITGRVLSAAGATSASEAWGKQSPWVDYTGEVAGNTFGVTLLDDPSNFRPSRYHVRDYGLFTMSPFGEEAYTKGERDAAPVTPLKGEPVTMRYGLYVHQGELQADELEKVYEKFVSQGD